MSNNYNHYIARGRSLEIIQKHLAISEAHLAAWTKVAKVVGATRLARQGFAYYGLICETDAVPEGWRKLKKEGCLVPARTKAGKAIQAELDAAPPYDPAKVSRDLVGRWAVDNENGGHAYPVGSGNTPGVHKPCIAGQGPCIPPSVALRPPTRYSLRGVQRGAQRRQVWGEAESRGPGPTGFPWQGSLFPSVPFWWGRLGTGCPMRPKQLSGGKWAPWGFPCC